MVIMDESGSEKMSETRGLRAVEAEEVEPVERYVCEIGIPRWACDVESRCERRFDRHFSSVGRSSNAEAGSARVDRPCKGS